MSEKKHRKNKNLKEILTGEMGGPLLEEALLIGMGIIIFVVIVNIISDLTTWLENLSNDLPAGIIGSSKILFSEAF